MYRVPDLPSWYSIKHFIRSRNIFHSKCGAAGSCLRIEWPYHVPHYPKAAGLIERWNGLLKLWCQLGNYTVKGWSSILQSGVYVFNQRLLHSMFFFFFFLLTHNQNQGTVSKWPHQIGRWEFRFWFPMLQSKERKKGGELKRRKPSSWFCFLRVRGKSGYCCTIKTRRTMSEIHRISRDPLSISTSSCKYCGKLYQLMVGKMTEDSGSSEMKISVN